MSASTDGMHTTNCPEPSVQHGVVTIVHVLCYHNYKYTTRTGYISVLSKHV